MGTGHGEYDVRAVSGGDDDGTLAESFQHMFGGHPRDHHVHHFPREQRFIAVHQGSLDRHAELGHGRCHKQRFLGNHVDRRPKTLAGLCDGRHLSRIATVGDHRCGVRVLRGQLNQAQCDGRSDLIWCAVETPHREDHRRSEIDRDAGVHTQLGGRGDVGVVRAHDHHGVATAGNRVVAIDDIGDRAVDVRVQALIAHPDAFLVGQSGFAFGQQ